MMCKQRIKGTFQALRWFWIPHSLLGCKQNMCPIRSRLHDNTWGTCSVFRGALVLFLCSWKNNTNDVIPLHPTFLSSCLHLSFLWGSDRQFRTPLQNLTYKCPKHECELHRLNLGRGDGKAAFSLHMPPEAELICSAIVAGSRRATPPDVQCGLGHDMGSTNMILKYAFVRGRPGFTQHWLLVIIHGRISLHRPHPIAWWTAGTFVYITRNDRSFIRADTRADNHAQVFM